MHAPLAHTLHPADSAVLPLTGRSPRTIRQPQWVGHHLKAKHTGLHMYKLIK